jgi:nicotinamidase-related amidase
MDAEQLFQQSKPFLTYIVEWNQGLLPLHLASVVDGQPQRVAILSVDMINGFCRQGPLASPRAARIVAPVVSLFRRAHELGVRRFALLQDTHDGDAIEFGSYPAHCIRGSTESDTVPELKALPFFDQYLLMPKNSVSCSLGTDLGPWLDTHPEVDTFIVVGVCTDICTYLLAMHLRMRANVLNQQVRVIVPVDCVDTYDLPVDVARNTGAVAHDGDLLHHVFLYHMLLNGIEVVSTLQ